MKRDAVLILTTAALACSLTLLATAGVCLRLGVLVIGGPDPIHLAADGDGAQLAVVYPVGDARDAEKMAKAWEADR